MSRRLAGSDYMALSLKLGKPSLVTEKTGLTANRPAPH